MAVAMKECPSCYADVPKSAKRCKDCFHDFESAPKSSFGLAALLPILLSVAGMVIVAVLTLGWIVTRPREQKTLVDQDSQSIVWTYTYVYGTTTDRLDFADVQRIEYTMHASGGYDITAITTNGSSKLIQESSSPLQGEANKYADLMKKQVTVIDNTRGFGG